MALSNDSGTTSSPFPSLGYRYDKGRYFQQPIGRHDRKFKVIVIGAGFSGVYAAIRVQQVLPDIDFKIYEKNPAVGGTWFENKYPGAACDIPSHRYTYTFELNPNWSHFYSESNEIREYIQNTAAKYDALKYVSFNHKLMSAIWDEEAGVWNLELEHDGGTIFDSCDVLINATGPLNKWKWPDIPNREDFKGDVLHSAAWDDSVSFEAKKIAVIGSGSSSIQIVPSLQPKADRMTVFIRSSTWISPPISQDMLSRHADGSLDTRYSEEQIKTFRDDPEALIAHREKLESGVSERFQLFLKDNPIQKTARAQVEQSMRQALKKKPELAKFLIPTFDLGCRRLTPGIGYCSALCADNVDVVTSGIVKFTENGLMTKDGRDLKFDAVICATGFDVSHKPRFTLRGRNGHELDDAFAANPFGYMAMAMPSLPNYFLINGPNAPIGQGSLVPASEAQVDYILKAVIKMRKQDIKSLCIKTDAVEEFTRTTDVWMADAVWSGACRSWYKGSTVDGRVSALWCGSGLSFIEAIEEPRWEDYDYTYLDSRSRYSYFGNGLVRVEVQGGNRNIQTLERIGLMRDHPALNDEERAEKERHYQAALKALERARAQNLAALRSPAPRRETVL